MAIRFRRQRMISSVACLGVSALMTVLVRGQASIQLRVDVTDASRKILHVRELIPAHPGGNTFEYPEWIQGAHMPVGPIDNITNVVFHAGAVAGPVLRWRRDLVDMYAFHVNAPRGTTAIAVTFDQLAVRSRFDTDAPEHYSLHTGMLEVSDAILYPAGVPVNKIPVAATIHMQDGWQMASALRLNGDDTSQLRPTDTTFAPVSVEQLVDSPIVFGEHCRQYPLAPELKPVHTMDVCADDAKELELRPALLDHMQALVRQATRTFQSHHYDHYDFVIAVSPKLQGDSLEHTQSADYIVSSLDVSKTSAASAIGDLLPHEYIHSWCGKYRRPIGLATPDYHVPMRDDLLWVYEGLTQYYGNVLTARSGFSTAAQAVQAFAREAATVNSSGRMWRSLQDTADASSILRSGDVLWGNTRRGQDYYSEGALIWLEADVKIRQLTRGRRSLDDFAKAFLGAKTSGGMGDTGPGVFPYRFEDVVAGLNAVAPYDWSQFWSERLTRLTERPPTEGLEAAGYTFGPSDTIDPEVAKSLTAAHITSATYSLGFSVGKSGLLRDVRFGSPAYKAGLGPGDTLVEVNGAPYTPELLEKAVHESAMPGSTLTLTAERYGESARYTLDWHGGDRFMRLTRNGSPDLLVNAIFQPKN